MSYNLSFILAWQKESGPMYADDTICIGTDTRSINKCLAEIDKEGDKYGMKLNKGKCEVIKSIISNMP